MMSEHTFIVTATDGGGILASTFYTITVIDENDNSPIFTMGNHYTVSLFENQNLNEVYYYYSYIYSYMQWNLVDIRNLTVCFDSGGIYTLCG